MESTPPDKDTATVSNRRRPPASEGGTSSASRFSLSRVLFSLVSLSALLFGSMSYILVVSDVVAAAATFVVVIVVGVVVAVASGLPLTTCGAFSAYGSDGGTVLVVVHGVLGVFGFRQLCRAAVDVFEFDNESLSATTPPRSSRKTRRILDIVKENNTNANADKSA